MTDGMFCAHCLSQYQEILSKTQLFGSRNCSKLGRSLYGDLSVYLKVTIHIRGDTYSCAVYRLRELFFSTQICGVMCLGFY